MTLKLLEKPLRINFILPYFGSRAGGGLKVMYEYAKRLSDRGHDVEIYSSIKTNYLADYDKSSFSLRLKSFKKSLRGRQRPTWFPLPVKVKCHMIPFVADAYIRNADVYISTWWATAYHISALSASKGIKFNLIQGYETIMTPEPESVVHDSYKLPVNHIVIAPYLHDIVSSYNRGKVEYIPNAVDLSIYTITNPIENRNSRSIIMRYANSKAKACSYALEAFNTLKERYPDLKVTLFASEKRPDNLPEWIEYIFGRSDTTSLYNEAAIYVSSSISEGWPLPPMEAMACGCACVCTDIPAHRSYMSDKENALLAKPESVDDMVDKISNLIEDNEARIELAKRANEYIQQYDWERSVDKMEMLFFQKIDK